MVKKMERVKKRMESNLVQVFMVKGLKKLVRSFSKDPGVCAVMRVLYRLKVIGGWKFC